MTTPRNTDSRVDAETVSLLLPSGPLEARFLPTMGARGPAPLILFTHGNGELATDWLNRFDAARRDGFAVLLVEYPGYGQRRGCSTPEQRIESISGEYPLNVAVELGFARSCDALIRCLSQFTEFERKKLA